MTQLFWLSVDDKSILKNLQLFGRAYPPLCAEFEGQRKQSKQRSTATGIYEFGHVNIIPVCVYTQFNTKHLYDCIIMLAPVFLAHGLLSSIFFLE